MAKLYSLLFLAPNVKLLHFFKHMKHNYYMSDNANVCSSRDMVLLSVIPTALTQSGFFPLVFCDFLAVSCRFSLKSYLWDVVEVWLELPSLQGIFAGILFKKGVFIFVTLQSENVS